MDRIEREPDGELLRVIDATGWDDNDEPVESPLLVPLDYPEEVND